MENMDYDQLLNELDRAGFAYGVSYIDRRNSKQRGDDEDIQYLLSRAMEVRTQYVDYVKGLLLSYDQPVEVSSELPDLANSLIEESTALAKRRNAI